MSSAEAQVVYEQTPFTEPDEAQETFARQFDLTQPEQAMSLYQRFVKPHLDLFDGNTNTALLE